MDEDDPDFPDSAWEARIEAAYRRMEQGLPPVPWLPRVISLTALRRQVQRARAGVIEPGNPRISTRAWADALEQGIVLNQLEMRKERREVEEQAEREAEEQRNVLEYNRCWMEVYQMLKRMPEAADPNSEIAAQITSMKRELRKLRGRPRRRRKGRQ